MEEFRFLRSYIADADSDIAMADLAILNQAFDRGLNYLRRDSKTHAGEAAGFRDQKRVDAHHFPMRIYQRPAGIARIDGRVGLDEFTRRTTVPSERVRPVQGADDATRHG